MERLVSKAARIAAGYCLYCSIDPVRVVVALTIAIAKKQGAPAVLYHQTILREMYDPETSAADSVKQWPSE